MILMASQLHDFSLKCSSGKAAVVDGQVKWIVTRRLRSEPQRHAT